MTNQDGEETDPVEKIPASLVDPYTLIELDLVIEEVLTWVSRYGASLRRKYVPDNPRLNCAALILLRLPQKDEKSGRYIDPLTWEEIAEQFRVPPEAIAAMRRCYGEKCRPCLQTFLRSRGYIDP
ncbi:hypothetical protein HJG54_00960 [Leptolyngbya sp. NK1-12]|uniref:Uncharacterized protein n=1 Tax=Leptolyngbya sp. NK1-12 TaxID=2547451 RepID=A0AA96WAI6_9CYAN|nr:hypothetical protein [Leptolyngbya sp. NK1-12]WNZ21578.1 hypothetical protein HJG54_00960 [Leptolyngbya sp. NK1-12]